MVLALGDGRRARRFRSLFATDDNYLVGGPLYRLVNEAQNVRAARWHGFVFNFISAAAGSDPHRRQRALYVRETRAADPGRWSPVESPPSPTQIRSEASSVDPPARARSSV